MRKFSILLLVLGMTSTAGAALSFGGVINGEIEVGTTGIVTIISDTTEAYFLYLGSDGGVTGVVPTFRAGEHADVIPDPYWPGFYELQAADMSAPFDSIQPGVHFNIYVYGAAVGDVYTLDRWNAAWDTILETGTVTVVPEPMTISLLGLGGLFLLRRRK